MLTPWTPLAATALVLVLVRGNKKTIAPDGTKSSGLEREADSTAFPRFLALWALLPLLLLTISKGKARNYALPVVPAYALLVASWWHSTLLDREVPLWGQRLFRVLARLLPLAVVGGAAVALVHDARALQPRTFTSVGDPAFPLLFDGHVLAAALLALVPGIVLFRRGRGGRLASRESGALLLGLVVIGGYIGYASTYFARRGDLLHSYEGLARDAMKQAGSRRLLLYHASDSWSGTFAFLSGRSTPEFNDVWDPAGEHFLAALGPADSDVALAPRGVLRSIALPGRLQLAIEWTGCREEDRGQSDKVFVLVHRRGAAEPAHDPLELERGS